MKRLLIELHLPHDKFSLGWEIYYPNEEFDTHEIKISLLLVTFTIEF